MAAEIQPQPPIGIMGDDGHVRLTLRAMNGITASLEQMRDRIATLESANNALADELFTARALLRNLQEKSQ